MIGTWPVCLTCHKEFIPIQGLSDCPWCSGAPDRIPGETWRQRAARRKREHRADLRALGRPAP